MRAFRLVVFAIASASALSTAEAGSRKKAKSPCPSGRYLLPAPLVVGEVAASVDTVIVGPATIEIAGLCEPIVPRKFRAARRGTRVKARWPGCAGLSGRVKLAGLIVDECDAFKGKLKARGFRQRIAGPRSRCGDGRVDRGRGEQCDPPGTGGCDAECREAVTATIGAAGGRITSADGKLTLEIPAGALAGDTAITVRRLEPEELPAAVRDENPEVVYDLQPDGLAFRVPATVTLGLDDRPSRGDGSVSGEAGILLTTNAGAGPAEPLAEQVIVLDGDQDLTTVSGQLTHFSNMFFVRLERIGRFSLSIPPMVNLNEPFVVDVMFALFNPPGQPEDVVYRDMTSSRVVTYTGPVPRTIGQMSTSAPTLTTTVDGYSCGNTPGTGVVGAFVTVNTFRTQAGSNVPFPVRLRPAMKTICGAQPGRPTTTSTSTTTTLPPGVTTTTSTSSSTTTSTSSSTTTTSTSTSSTSTTSTTTTSTSSSTTTTIPCALDEGQSPPVCGGDCPPSMLCRFSPAEGGCACVPTDAQCAGRPDEQTGLCGGFCPRPIDLCGLLEPNEPQAVCTCAPPCETQSPGPPTQCGGGLCPPGQECVTTAERCACAPVETTSTTTTSSTTTSTSTTSTTTTTTVPATTSTTTSTTTTSTSTTTSSTTTTTTTAAPTTTTTTTLATGAGGRALVLAVDTGPFPAGTIVCLGAIHGGCVAAPDLCEKEHVHLTVAIDGASGDFPDPDPTRCGRGTLLQHQPGCPADSMRFCGVPIPVTAVLSGMEVVPPSGSAEIGTCSGAVTPTQSALGISCSQNVANATEAHIHLGAPGTNGPILASLSVSASSAGGTLPMTPGLLSQLQAGNVYVDIHSTDFPDGSVRGRVWSDLVFNFPLDGTQEVPPTASTAVGQCAVLINANRTALSLRAVHDVANPIAAHIHEAPPGVNGPIVFDLGNGMSPIDASATLNSVVSLEALRAGNLYVNVHSTSFPDGEIRGPIQGVFVP